jgi:hypothetical protein
VAGLGKLVDGFLTTILAVVVSKNESAETGVELEAHDKYKL